MKKRQKNLLGLYAKIDDLEADVLLNSWEDPDYWNYSAGDAKRHFHKIVFRDLKQTIDKFKWKYGLSTDHGSAIDHRLLKKLEKEYDKR